MTNPTARNIKTEPTNLGTLPTSMGILRSVASVVAGIAAFSLALLAAMTLGQRVLGGESEWINRSVATQLVWLAWNVVSMAGAGYITAAIAPRARVAHGLV